MKPEQSHITDALAKKLASGDITAFDAIYAAYSPVVYKEAYRMLRSSELAKDVVQEVFTLVWDKRTGFTAVAHLRAYLVAISKNLVYQYFLRLAKEQVANSEFSFALKRVANGTEQVVNFNELETLFEKAVNSLPDRQREVYTLASDKGLDYDAIASHLNISRNTVKNHLIAARNFIRKCLQHAALFVFWGLLSSSAGT